MGRRCGARWGPRGGSRGVGGGYWLSSASAREIRPRDPRVQALFPLGPVAVLKGRRRGRGGRDPREQPRLLERDRPIVAVEVAAREPLKKLRRLLGPLSYMPVGQC